MEPMLLVEGVAATGRTGVPIAPRCEERPAWNECAAMSAVNERSGLGLRERGDVGKMSRASV